MTSSMLSAQTGIDTPEVFDESASYIAGWLHALNDDKRLVITAAAHAQRASDLIAEPERQATRDNERPGNSLGYRQLIGDSERDGGPVAGGGNARGPSEPHAQPGTSDAAKRPGDWQAEAG